MAIELLVIVALVSFIIGLVAGILLGVRIVRGHMLYLSALQQPPLPPQPQPHRTRHLRRNEDYY